MKKTQKKVLVYPCGTEIGLEINKAIEYSTWFELWGGSSNYDHGRYVYKNHIDNLPFITDNSDENEILEFNKIIEPYNFDFIYPAMDGVLYKFSQYSKLFSSTIVAPEFNTARITRSKKLTYQYLNNEIAVPEIYKNISEIKNYPIFIKPDIGQGSRGAQKIDNERSLIYLSLSDEDQKTLQEMLAAFNSAKGSAKAK